MSCDSTLLRGSVLGAAQPSKTTDHDITVMRTCIINSNSVAQANVSSLMATTPSVLPTAKLHHCAARLQGDLLPAQRISSGAIAQKRITYVANAPSRSWVAIIVFPRPAGLEYSRCYLSQERPRNFRAERAKYRA